MEEVKNETIEEKSIKEIEFSKERKCDYCELILKNKLGYLAHVRGKHKEQWYKDHPNDKKKVFTRKNPIKNDINIDVKCEYCDERFNNNEEYVSHLNEFHKEEFETIKEEKSNEKIIRVGDSYKTIKFKNEENTEEDEKENDENIVFPFIHAPKKQIKISKPVTLEPREAFISQLLIEQGFARDLSELQKKSLRLAYSMMNVGAAAGNYKDVQMDGKKSTSELLDEIKRRKIEQLEIEQLEKEIRSQNNNNQDGGKKMDLGEIMILQSFMNQNKPQQENNNLKNTLEIIQLLNSQQKQPNMTEMMTAISALNSQPKQNSNDQQLEFFKLILDAQKGNTNMTEIVSLINDKNKNQSEKALELEKLRSQHMTEMLGEKINQLQNQIQNTPKSEWDPDVMAQKFESIKKLSDIIRGEGGQEKNQPNPLEYIEGIGKTVGPAIAEMMKTKQEALRTEQMNIQHQMQQNAISGGLRKPVKKEFYQEVEDDLTEEEINNMSEEEIVEHYKKLENSQIKRDIVIQPKYQNQKIQTKQRRESLYNRGTIGNSDVSIIPKSRVELPGTQHDPINEENRQ
ncbi:MAG: hypothetical protein Q7R52_02810 [archaeon]|nr:hypothetical protein [archaeon]